MRIVSWNIQHLEPYEPGVDPSAEFTRALAEMRPDVLLLQEVDHLQERSDHVNQTALAADALGAGAQLFRATPASAGNYGIATISNIPVTSWFSKSLRRSPVGMRLTFIINGQPETFYCADHERAVVAAQLDNGWLVANMHASFVPGWSHLMVWRATRWARKEAKRLNCRLLMCGDFNLSSHRFLNLIGLRSLNAGVTFPTWAPDRQIDFIAVERDSPTRAHSVEVKRFGVSDHCAVIVDI